MLLEFVKEMPKPETKLRIDLSSLLGTLFFTWVILQLFPQWHPDRWTRTPSLLGEAKRKFQQIQEAYSVLSDQRKRTLYDAGLYDPEDEEDEGFSDFLAKMISLMIQTRTENFFVSIVLFLLLMLFHIGKGVNFISYLKNRVLATGEKDVAFKVLYCGICHSDLHMVKNEWGSSIYPLIPGHEIAGEVTEVGSKAGVGTLDGIIDTVSAQHPLLPLLRLLKSHEKLVLVGGPEKPLRVTSLSFATR
ncbi:hypothetical protein CRYUN_Cryun03dG0093100 [Craigia yunnanensis]